MCLLRAFDTYMVKVLGMDAESLNSILHSTSNNNLRATHAASIST
jgi:hypothetical protein